MTAQIAIGIYWTIFLSTLLLRYKSCFHPVFALAAMLFILFGSDFVFRGTADDPWILRVPADLLPAYHTLAIAISSLIVAGAAILNTGMGVEANLPNRTAKISRHQIWLITIISAAILGIEIAKRASVSGWSLGTVLAESLAPRHTASWLVEETQNGNFLFSLSESFFPFAGIGFGFAAIAGKGATRVVSVLCLVVVLFFLLAKGSRTLLALTFASMIVFTFTHLRSAFAKCSVTIVLVTAFVAFSSAQIRYRASGMENAIAGGIDSFTPYYHQDNNYQLTMWAFYLSDSTADRWDPKKYITTALTHPIPRALWSSKPKLDASYYGAYKYAWYTNGFMAESVAMFGLEAGFFFSIAYGLTIAFVLQRATRLLQRPFGVAAYSAWLVYGYMCLRSILNITQWIYMPALATVAVITLGILESKFRNRVHGATCL